MRKSLISIFVIMIIAAFISACYVNRGQEVDSDNDAETFANISEEEIKYDYPVVCYKGHDYLQYGNAWSDRDEEWLNENYTYVGEAEYYSDYALGKGKGDFTTINLDGGCKIYRCNDEDTFIFTLWGDGTIYLFCQNDLTDEERESASAATDWKS